MSFAFVKLAVYKKTNLIKMKVLKFIAPIALSLLMVACSSEEVNTDALDGAQTEASHGEGCEDDCEKACCSEEKKACASKCSGEDKAACEKKCSSEDKASCEKKCSSEEGHECTEACAEGCSAEKTACEEGCEKACCAEKA